MQPEPDMARAPSALAVVLSLGGLYVAQSVIGGFTWGALPTVMRDQGLPLDQVGLVSLVALPWALKFLWSPYVERYRLPASGRNRSGMVVLAGGLMSIAGLLTVGLLAPAAFWPTMAGLTAVAFAAATVDIACDGYAVERLAQQHHGWGNAAQVGGAYLGSAVGGGLFLVLFAAYGWQMGIWTLALLLLLLGAPFLMLAVRDRRTEARPHRPSLAVAIKRPEIRRGLLAAALYVLAQKVGLTLLGPFLIDAGFDVATVGILNGLGSLIVGFAAAILGGGLVSRWGVRTVLSLAVAAQAAALFFFAACQFFPGLPKSSLVAAALASSAILLPIGFVALYAQFMRWSDPRQAGIDFTLFQCMDALVSMIGGIAAGTIAQHFGYGIFFAGMGLIALVSVPAIFAIAGTEQDRGEIFPRWRGGLLPTGDE